MMRLLIVATALFGCASACSLAFGEGYSGGIEQGAGGADAASDVAANGDGGGDSSGPDGGAKRFCETLTQPARACIDFDDGRLPVGFSAEADNGGSATLATGGKDGTGGLVSAVTTSAANDASACIHITLSGPRTSITIESDFRVAVVGTANYDLIDLETASDRELGISMTGSKLLIEEDFPVAGGTEGTREFATSAVATGSWQRLRFVVSRASDATATGVLFVDGAPVGELGGILASTMTDTTKFEIGDCSLVGAQGWTVHFDNVVVYETN